MLALAAFRFREILGFRFARVSSGDTEIRSELAGQSMLCDMSQPL